MYSKDTQATLTPPCRNHLIRINAFWCLLSQTKLNGCFMAK